MNGPRVVISCCGVASAAGRGIEALARAVDAGVPLARAISLFDASGFPHPRGCEVPGLDPRALAPKPKDAKVLARASVVALAALEELRASSPAPFVGDPWRAGFFLGVGLEQSHHADLPAALAVSRTRNGTISIEKLAREGVASMNPLAALRTLPNMAICHVAMKLGDAGPRGANAAYSPFDAAAIEAVGAAFDSIRRRECEVALAGGADSLLSVFGWTLLHRLGLLSERRPAGEGAALFVLETAERATAAGRPILAEIAGHGSSADGAPAGRPSIAGAKAAIRAALAWGGTKPALVDTAVLSGGGTDASPDEVAFDTVLKEASSTRRLGRERASVVHPRPVIGEAGAGTGALSIALGLARIAAGATRVLVSGCAWGGSHAAVVLKRWRP